MAVKKAGRNGLIDIMRLIFAWILVMYHFYSNGEKHFHGGLYGVEFFVILSGLLFFTAWDQKRVAQLPVEGRKNYWISYMRKRYTRFFWCSFPAFVMAFFIVRVWHGKLYDVVGIIDRLSVDVWDVLLVKMNGINQGTAMLNVPAWTLSCMLIAEFFILGMLTFWERPVQNFLMPLSVIIGTGVWMNLDNRNHRVFLTLFTAGTFRVYLLVCFGIFAYLISQKIRFVAFSNAGRWLLTALEVAGYAICLLICFFRISENYQLCFTVTATLVLAISFSGKSFAGSILPANSITNFCAEYSLGLYLTHYSVLRIFRYTYTEVNELYRQKWVFWSCALAAALFYTFLMRGMFKMLPAAKQKLKAFLVEPDK